MATVHLGMRLLESKVLNYQVVENLRNATVGGIMCLPDVHFAYYLPYLLNGYPVLILLEIVHKSKFKTTFD